MLELKRGGHARVQTEMVEFIALPYPSSNKKLKIWSFHVVVVQGRRRNVEKKRDARAKLPLSSPSLFRKVPILSCGQKRTGTRGSQMLSRTRLPLVDTTS